MIPVIASKGEMAHLKKSKKIRMSMMYETSREIHQYLGAITNQTTRSLGKVIKIMNL